VRRGTPTDVIGRTHVVAACLGEPSFIHAMRPEVARSVPGSTPGPGSSRTVWRPLETRTTSFNGRGEPIVSSVADAVGCFRRLRLVFLVLDDQLFALDGRW